MAIQTDGFKFAVTLLAAFGAVLLTVYDHFQGMAIDERSSKASEYLMLCEKVYFIGYSFPETDVQMKIFVSNALRKNKNLKEVTIVSNPMYGRSRVDFEERYSPILLKTKNDPKIIFNYDGFERFSKEKLSEVDGRRKVIS